MKTAQSTSVENLKVRPLGRSRLRLEDNIELDLKEINCQEVHSLLVQDSTNENFLEKGNDFVCAT
jgi:hypothetical protein